ncbi:MAG TPA: hypothetical protein VLF62_01410 [Candidatus Saccharimonadales bacterium]|nr:hypothetical protein [Candidatus Saccharimonadales bacterium]
MKLKKKHIIGLVAAAVLAVAGFGIYWMQAGPGSARTITGRVTKVTFRPNLAEDGYYGFTVQGTDDKTYTIDATGLMNIPPSFNGASQECVPVPHLEEGDAIEFKLRKSESSKQAFVTCDDKGSSGYYIRRIR